MIDTTSFSSQLFYCTVRVTGHKPNGETSIGTAFFFKFNLGDNRDVLMLVTNKHVIAGCTRGNFLLHEQDRQTKQPAGSFTVELDNFEALWLKHPGDVDLCAMPVVPIMHVAEEQGKVVYLQTFVETHIPSPKSLDSLTAIEDVIMVGYPIGLWDSANNFPLLRKGITASHPAVDFNNRPEGFVDIAAFPGSSGSPVLILNEGSYPTRKGLAFGSRCLLLGVLHAGPQYKPDGTLEIVEIPTLQLPVVRTTRPVHLGIYAKSRELLTIKQTLIEFLTGQELKE